MNLTEHRGLLPAVFTDEETPTPLKRWEIIFLSLTAFVCMLFFTQSSPFYAINLWPDANCFFTVGKSVLNGKVLYRDIYEQKGPILYFLHTLAALVSDTSFIGVFLLEIPAAAVTLVWQYKILRLYVQHRSAILIMPVLAVFMYTGVPFWMGDSAEEFCLPILSWSLWLGLCIARSGKMPSLRTGILLGMLSGCILWIKFNLLGFYVGWIILIGGDLLLQKRLPDLGKLIGSIALGVCLITIPVLLYFAFNHALKDLFTVYFYNNIFIYDESDSAPALKNFLAGLGQMVDRKEGILIVLLQVSSLVLMGRKRMKETLLLLLCYFVEAAFIFTKAIRPYYRLVLDAFLPIAFLPVGLILQELWKRKKRVITGAFVAAELLSCVYFIHDDDFLHYLFVPREELPEFQFAEIIDSVPDSTMLFYNKLDGGFYLAADKLPTGRFFCRLNIKLPEMDEELDRMVENGETTFVISRDTELSSDKYSLVAESSLDLEGEHLVYFLYQRTDD